MQVYYPDFAKTVSVKFVCSYCGKESYKRVKNENQNIETFIRKDNCFCSRLCERLHREEHELDDIINDSQY